MTVGLLTRARQATASYNSGNKFIDTLDEFWAYATVNARKGIKIGGNYTFAGATTATPVTASNIVSCLVDANKAGEAYYIADVKITTPASETKKEGIVLSAYAEAKSTIITMPKYDFVLRHAENEGYANYLRSNPEDDVFLFTNTGIIHLEYAKMPLSYTVGGTERGGTGGTSAGGFKFSIMGKSFTGNPEIQDADTTGSNAFPKYVITDTTLNNCTLLGTKGDLTVMKRTSATVITELVVANGGYSTNWILVNYVTGLEILGTVATFDPVLSKIVIPANAPAGVLPIKLIAYNEVGAKGEKLYEFNL